MECNVEIALDPSWIGSLQKRRLALTERNGKKLMILRPTQFLVLPVRCSENKNDVTVLTLTQGGIKTRANWSGRNWRILTFTRRVRKCERAGRHTISWNKNSPQFDSVTVENVAYV